MIFANDLLQGESGRAWDTTRRFVINSTVGIAGLFDVADFAAIGTGHLADDPCGWFGAVSAGMDGQARSTRPGHARRDG